MPKRGRILVVDDEVNARTALTELLRDEGFSVESAGDGYKALPKLDDFAPDVIVTDLRMPGMDGIQLMRKAHARDPDCAVVVVTAYGAVDTAVTAMKEGAADYVTKPVNMEELVLVLTRALESRSLRAEARSLRQQLGEERTIENIVGTSPQMRRVMDEIVRVAPSRATVLITGETGTGKELVASALHRHGTRQDGPYVKLHCTALAETLLESELFGHERGAFTGATSRRDGRFQQADGGTLFLDEIGEISPSLQVKLLRFLQEHEFQRVGGNQTIQVDVRVVAATNRDLEQRVREGTFREDLFYRLNVVSIDVPPLRARPDDIPLLAMHFLAKYAAENGKSVSRFSDEALARLIRHRWPGNVRELENAVERAVVLSSGEVIPAEDLPHGLGGGEEPQDGMPRVPGSTLADLERYAILKTLEFTGGSTSRAADLLGISVRKVQYKLQEYRGDPPPDKPR